MKKLWFKAKHYGWGWYPSSWEGWSTIIIYILLMFGIAIRIDSNSHSVSDTMIGAVVPFFIITVILIGICYATGEKPRWRWGK